MHWGCSPEEALEKIGSSHNLTEMMRAFELDLLGTLWRQSAKVPATLANVNRTSDTPEFVPDQFFAGTLGEVDEEDEDECAEQDPQEQAGEEAAMAGFFEDRGISAVKPHGHDC